MITSIHINKKGGLLLLLAALCVILISSQKNYLLSNLSIQKIKEKLEAFNSSYPQQKVYIHTDKNEYTIYENIWLKAYVVSVFDYSPDTLSDNLYIDFVSPHQRIFNRLLLKLENGFSYGDISLANDSLPDGNYQIKAYTNWMKNFDEDYIFTKTITIKNPNYQKYLIKDKSKENKRYNKTLKKKEKDITIRFFPEGGTFLADITNRVGFKAVNELGEGVNFTGIIVDSKGNIVTPVKSYHLGMGAFTITPEKDKKYYLITESPSKKQKIQLPAAEKHGIRMTVNAISDPGQIKIHVATNEKAYYDEVANQVFLVGMARNTIYYSVSKYLSKQGLTISIPKNKFPSGVIQFSLFNNRLEPFCERLAFIDHQEDKNIHLKVTSQETGDKNRTEYHIALDKEGRPLESNVSVSIVNGIDSAIYDVNILTELLLASDVKGYIENAGFYFEDHEKSKKALDYLLMTQGWRRFVWKEIMQDEYPVVEYPIEEGITITGKITRSHFNIPIKESKVTLYILDEYNDFFTWVTDKRGIYKFNNLEYYDTINVRIEARTPLDRKNLLIYVNESGSPATTFYNQDYLLDDFDRHALVVPNVSEKIEKKDYDLPKYYGDADYVLDLDEINTEGYSDLLQVIDSRVPGVMVVGDDIEIRGTRSLNSGRNAPLVLVDGIPAGVEMLKMISPQDVQVIEFLTGPSTAIYGFRGSNGVIAVYTRRGQFMKRGEISFQMLGYYKAREFYRPKLTSEEGKNKVNVKSSTIYWNPDVITDSNGESHFYIDCEEIEKPMYLSMEGISYTGDIIRKYIKLQ